MAGYSVKVTVIFYLFFKLLLSHGLQIVECSSGLLQQKDNAKKK
jgi:hypothetical protein